MEKLVVGLGNPGPEYEWTRHNVGFHVLDLVAKRQGALFQSGRELAEHAGPKAFGFARIRVARPACAGGPASAVLLKPETFMNRSGSVVASVASALGSPAAEILVVYDDLDLPLGKLRIRPHGGPGTHNGMRSIVESLATDRFPRLRVGIGPARTDAARHVLEKFTEKEQVEIEISVAEAAEALEDWLATGDIEGCMTRFHSRWNPGV